MPSRSAGLSKLAPTANGRGGLSFWLPPAEPAGVITPMTAPSGTLATRSSAGLAVGRPSGPSDVSDTVRL